MNTGKRIIIMISFSIKKIQAADLIFKLQVLASELPSGGKENK